MGAAIGTRYTSAHIVRRDSSTGVYEELNSPLYGVADQNTQAWLISKASPLSAHRAWRVTGWAVTALTLVFVIAKTFA